MAILTTEQVGYLAEQITSEEEDLLTDLAGQNMPTGDLDEDGAQAAFTLVGWGLVQVRVDAEEPYLQVTPEGEEAAGRILEDKYGDEDEPDVAGPDDPDVGYR